MKKVVIKLAILDERDKKKVLRAVSGLSGVDSIAMDMKDKKLTVIGDVDPVEIVGKLRKIWHPDLESVGPSKEPEKKKEPAKTPPTESEQLANLLKYYTSYNSNAYMAQAQAQPQHYYLTQQHQPYYYNLEENPNSCVIC